MTPEMEQKNKLIKELLNGTITALKAVVPVEANIKGPKLLNENLHLGYGVLIGFVGDVKGKIVIKGDESVFGELGQVMFGMPLEGEMLASFTGEFGNMLAGSLATSIAKNGFQTDITSPTVMQGNTILSGFKRAIALPVAYDNMGDLEIYILLD